MNWLSESHEPSYSRWLAWVLERIGIIAAISVVLGLKDPSRHTGTVSTDAEVRVLDQDRPDIVVYCDDGPVVVVETKLGSADEDALRDQLGRYREWIKQHRAKGVLIVRDAEKERYEGFSVRRWDEVCVQLRRAAARLAGERPPLVVAMILAFVGAVEQNILGFPSLDDAAPLLYPRVAAHLKACLEEGP